jgi:hypothetical protein
LQALGGRRHEGVSTSAAEAWPLEQGRLPRGPR